MTASASDGYDAAKQQFESAGLPFPYIPPALRHTLVPAGDWHYTTDPAASQDQRAVFDRLKENQLEDFARLTHIGHGHNSWLIRYELVLRPLMIFLEQPWGGAYTSGDAGAIRAKFDAAQQLTEAVEAGKGDFGANEYLLILDTSIAGGQWLRLTVPSTSHPLAMTWKTSDDALADALASLQG